jgi:hypothetical protein
MKTLTKTLALLSAVLLVAGCAVNTAEAEQAWTPGWRHEQMMKAFQDGKAAPGPMMMRRAGYGPGWAAGAGRGPVAPAADAKLDPTTLPPGCPFNQPKPDTTK